MPTNFRGERTRSSPPEYALAYAYIDKTIAFMGLITSSSSCRAGSISSFYITQLMNTVCPRSLDHFSDYNAHKIKMKLLDIRWYCLIKKSLPNLYRSLLYEIGQDFWTYSSYVIKKSFLCKVCYMW